MNGLCWRFAAALTNAASGVHRSTLRGFPANAVTMRWPPFPAGVSPATDEFRLPLCHTVVVAEDPIGVKVTTGSDDRLAAPFTDTCLLTFSSRIGLALAPHGPASGRAKALLAPAGACRGFAADFARRLLLLTPPMREIALCRAEAYQLTSPSPRAKLATALRAGWVHAIPAVKCPIADRLKGAITCFALARLVHGIIISQLAEYHDMAANRLQQDVLALEVQR